MNWLPCRSRAGIK